MTPMPSFLGAIRTILNEVHSEQNEEFFEPWMADPTLFEHHFGIPYDEFDAMVELLSVDQHKRFDATLKVNPEAAVTWVLSMDL